VILIDTDIPGYGVPFALVLASPQRAPHSCFLSSA